MTTGYTPGTQIDHYQIIRMLGHGGMSRVYLANDLEKQNKVVLKFLNDDLIGDIAVFERYRRESEIGSRLNHPHIQHTLNVDEKRSDEYLVVEYIEGQTLRHLLEEHEGKVLLVQEALRITDQICDAVIYCHAHGVYHRDLKPENIMLKPDGNVKIIDFGIALLEGARRVTMMLYEMLCGHTPFDGENIFAVMNQHVSHDPPSILQHNPDLDPALATVVMRAIRRDHEKRYTSASDLRADLQHLAEVKPVPYQPEEPKANRTARTAIIATLIIIAIFLAIIAIGLLAQGLHPTGH